MMDISIYSELCKSVVNDLLKEENIFMEEEKVDSIVLEVLNITYSIGGGFKKSLLSEITRTFLFKKDGIKKYLK